MDLIFVKIYKFNFSKKKKYLIGSILGNNLHNKWMAVKKLNIVKTLKKIRFESDDDLPMNKPIKLRLLTIIIRCAFSEDGQFYAQLF